MKAIRKHTILPILLLCVAIPSFLFTFGCSDNEALPASLIALRERNPETADFVKAYPTEGNKTHEIDLSSEYTPGKIPLLLQWDTRWGYELYGNEMIAVNGCGPTCLSMVAIGLTGNTSWDPLTVANYAEENGYYCSGSGSYWTLMSTGSQMLELHAEELPLDENTIRYHLSQGHPIVCVVGPGDFTTDGHFIIITGQNDDGTVTINDPNSKLRSAQNWDLQQIMNQMQNLWAFTAL